MTFEPAGASFSYAYQWQADGADIAGATNKTYVPGVSDLGKQVTVKVTASLPGVDPDSATSRPVTISDLNNTVAPSDHGFPDGGRHVDGGSGAVRADAGQLHVSVVVGGTPHRRCDGATYVPTSDELGRRISVEVVATKAGYIPMTLFTAETAGVGAGV